MVKLAVFDLDGTLVNSLRDLATGVNCMRACFNLPPVSLDMVTSFIGGGVKTLVQKAIADADGEIDLTSALGKMKQFYAEHLVDTTELFAMVAETLETLHKEGIILAVVSNKEAGATTTILEHLEIRQFFRDIIGGDSQFPLKPEPDSLIHLMHKHSLKPENCWMIGDHYTDLESGRRAGFKRIFCRYGFGELRCEAPDFFVDCFADIADILSKN